MVFYYTYKQKTKIFAQAISAIFDMPTYALQTDLGSRSYWSFMFKALRLAFSGKSYPVSNMPETVPSEIFVCSPIWGGNLAAPAKYLLENIDLQGTTVHLILTASMPSEKYKKAALEYLQQRTGCIPGEVHVFLTSDKFMPELEVLTEQLRTVVGQA